MGIPRISKHENYLNIAKEVCKRSTCLRRHYGAVIVKNDVIIATGYNGSPRGMANCCDTGICHRVGCEHNDGNYAKCPAVHAEQNAIIAVSREQMLGSTLYLYGEDFLQYEIPAAPCPICMNMIANAGISKIIVHDHIDNVFGGIVEVEV